jgi:hypothetical protein
VIPQKRDSGQLRGVLLYSARLCSTRLQGGADGGGAGGELLPAHGRDQARLLLARLLLVKVADDDWLWWWWWWWVEVLVVAVVAGGDDGELMWADERVDEAHEFAVVIWLCVAVGVVVAVWLCGMREAACGSFMLAPCSLLPAPCSLLTPDPCSLRAPCMFLPTHCLTAPFLLSAAT